jgi:type VI secretion system protein ImpF
MDEEFEPRLPCLFDRLIDEYPDSLEDRDHRRAINLQDYRAGVLRDLGWLLNSFRHPPEKSGTEILGDRFRDYPEVASSVLNYGIRDIGGISVSSLENSNDVLHEIEECIRHFEPRIAAESLRVRVVAEAESATVGKMAFEVTGELWALPFAERISFRTEMVLEAGTCEIKPMP